MNMRPLTLDANVPLRQKAMTNLTSAEQNRRRWTLIAPVLLVLTTFAVFQVATMEAGERIGQLTGFAYYWTAGGIIIPLILLERRGYSALFNRPGAKLNGVVALFMPAAFGFLFAFPYLFPAASSLLLPSLALYAILNGTFEEVFWRGLFISRFRDNAWLGVVYPGVLFGLWQLVPWLLFDSWFHPSWFLLLGAAISVGLLYSWVAWRTESIRWNVIAHTLANLSGIGSLIVFAASG
jgi:membrane protease YdiL (CAAX protease family)